MKKSILLQFVVGSPICSPICTGLMRQRLCFMPGFRVLHNSTVRRIKRGNILTIGDSHVVINRPPSGGNSFEWCRNADVWCSLCVFGHCPQQNKEIEPDNVITNDYMLFY